MKYVIYNNYDDQKKYIAEIPTARLRWTPDWQSAMHFDTVQEAQRSINVVKYSYIHASQMQMVVGLSYISAMNLVEELLEM